MEKRAFLVHALSPLHSGTGHSADLVDLPIARMKATNIPYLPGSSIKGVLREQRSKQNPEAHFATFGPDTANASDHAGALVVGDARLVAMPVRSMVGTFAWVSSPLLLRLAARDLVKAPKLPALGANQRVALVGGQHQCTHNQKVYLEDLDLPAQTSAELEPWAKKLAALACPDDPRVFTSRFIVVDDETMNFLLETATQLDARVRIDPETRTVAAGALWLEESLPAESLLIGLLAADRSRRRDCEMTPAQVLDFALPAATDLQFGGKTSVGRGRCRLMAIPV
jgi:CRISPR-associated protein Cmr4